MIPKPEFHICAYNPVGEAHPVLVVYCGAVPASVVARRGDNLYRTLMDQVRAGAPVKWLYGHTPRALEPEQIPVRKPAEYGILVKFPAKPEGHKYAPGDICRLKDLTRVKQFNGQIVEIIAPRDIYDTGGSTKAYYVGGAINAELDWVYEDRLELVVRAAQTSEAEQ